MLGGSDLLLDLSEVLLGCGGVAEVSEVGQLVLVAALSIAKLQPCPLDAEVGGGRFCGVMLVFGVACLGLAAGVVTDRRVDARGVIGPVGEAGDIRVLGGHGGDNRLPAD